MKKTVKKTSIKVDYKIVSFIIFTIGFFAIFAIRPSVSLIFNLVHEKEEYEKIDRVLEGKIQQIIITQGQFMELISNKELVEQALPNNHRMEKTKDFLTLNPDLSEFVIQKIKILPKTEAGLNKVIFNLGGSSDYDKVLKLLSYINSSRRLITISYLNLNTESASSESASLNFNTILNTYYYVEM